MNRALYKDMSKEELLKMREQGMSNQEIADSLDVSYMTIYRLIGPAPKELRKTYTRACKNSSENLRGGVAEEETHEACLTIKRPEIYMVGNKWRYSATPGGNRVRIQTEAEGHWFSVDLEDLPQIIKELQAIVRNTEKITCGNVLEVW